MQGSNGFNFISPLPDQHGGSTKHLSMAGYEHCHMKRIKSYDLNRNISHETQHMNKQITEHVDQQNCLPHHEVALDQSDNTHEELTELEHLGKISEVWSTLTSSLEM